jgi:hypothetical protein
MHLGGSLAGALLVLQAALLPRLSISTAQLAILLEQLTCVHPRRQHAPPAKRHRHACRLPHCVQCVMGAWELLSQMLLPLARVGLP